MTYSKMYRRPTVPTHPVLHALFSLLESAPFGAYAVSVEQEIVFWNRTAEHILGFSSREILGRRCYEVASRSGSRGMTPECDNGCSSIRYLRSGRIPPPARLSLLCSSGSHKWISTAPMVIAGMLDGGPVLFHLFDDAGELEDGRPSEDPSRHEEEMDRSQALPQESQSPQLTDDASNLSRRELEVLQLVAEGWETCHMAERLGISRHTVRNHIRNLAHKLGASSKLDAVVKGIRLGIVTVKRSP